MLPPTHEVVVLGGNFAGLDITHILNRQIFPALRKLDPSLRFHVTVVSPNSHFFFKVAAPRALINATLIPTEKIFKSVPEGLKQYGETVTHLQAKATGLDPEAKTVTVALAAGTSQELKYDSLFIATGTTSASPLWSLHDDHEVSLQAFRSMNDILPKAETVLIGGGGPVGVETAGEIAAAFPGKKITLVSGGEILQNLNAGTIAKAKRVLQAAGVEILTQTKVNSFTSVGAQTKVELSDGSSRTVDIYIDARGASKINSEFLPKSWLDTTGRVIADSYFRVKGDESSNMKGIYVLGDIVAGSTNTIIDLGPMVSTVSSTFAVDIATQLGKTKASGGLLSWIPGFGSKGVAQKEFKPMKDTMFVPIGPKSGVGQVFGWAVPTLMVKKAKSEKFFVEIVDPILSGKGYAQL